MRTFISYSHEDVDAVERLLDHLANLLQQGRITIWYDRKILAGSVLDDEISQELESADLFLLMVSPDFIASNYCVGREMKRALERHAAGEAHVVPIILEPCDWKAIPELHRLKAVPKDCKPISKYTNENDAYFEVVQELRRIVDSGKESAPEPAKKELVLPASRRAESRYRVLRDFDEIERSDYREAAFEKIKIYFQREIDEINKVDGPQGRFIDRGATSFGSMVVNRVRQHRTAHITVYCRNANRVLGDVSYSFDEHASENSANGWFHLASDGYELFLVMRSFANFGNKNQQLNPEQAAELLWNEFIKRAGITQN